MSPAGVTTINNHSTMDIAERFINYTKFDTQSAEDSQTVPSTPKQLIFAQYLKKELEDEGLKDVEMDEMGYIYATLPGNTDKDVPTIGFISHYDTALDASGANIKALILQVANVATIHGADDKAGIAEIVQAMCYLRDHNEIKHGDIRVAFNPDEEIGMGAHHFDVEKFGCQWAYTMDGGDIGDLEYENFNAAAAKVTIKGISVHTGYAKDKMVNASRLACEFNAFIPDTDIPETTEGYQGFFHLIGINSHCEEAKLSYIIRDHDRKHFEQRKDFLESIAEQMNKKYGEGTVAIEMKDQYYNMKEKIDPNMYVIDIVLKAMQESGVTPKVEPIRGGTDGAQLSFRGLPCPNIFAGGVNFHGPYEFVSIQVMEKAVKVITKICEITGTYND